MTTAPSTLEHLFPGNPALVEQIRAQDRALGRELLERLTRPLPTENVSDWAQRCLWFHEPKFHGPFSTHTRRYIEEPLNLWRRDVSNDITDLIIAWATRSAKTRVGMAGAGYRIANDPMRCLWTKPMKHGAGGSRNDAKTKIIPMILASPGLKHLAAKCDKNDLNGNQMRIGGSIIDMEGTGSPKQLSGNPDDVVVQDECDGYVLKGHTEAHPSILADERTKDASNPLRFKCCSPTVEEGVIWQWLLRGDLRRRFLCCPRCSPLRTGRVSKGPRDFADLLKNKFFVLAWNEQFNVLPLKMQMHPGDDRVIPIAYVHWDKAAKMKDGAWDITRVMQTAHFKCPHCQGPVHNFEKEWMDERGQWAPTKTGAPGIASFQLSSLYVTHDETAIGAIAKRFLLAQASGQAMKGVINNDLAEVDAKQEHGRNQVELISRPRAESDWVPLLTGDYQKNWPYLWWVIRKWCAFKLLPPFGIANGVPDFVPALDLPENRDAKIKCAQLLGIAAADGVDFEATWRAHKSNPAWTAIAELMRFDSRTGRSPLVEFLIAGKFTGAKLVKLFREAAGANTLDFRKLIYQEMAKAEGRDPATVRPARGGDSELIAAGHCALSGEFIWDELREVIQHYQVGHGMPIPGRCVAIDCGYAEKFNREVLRKCYESATAFKFYDPMSKNRPAIFYKAPIHNFCIPCPRDGWFATKGYPINQRWNHGGIRNELNINLEDPFFGSVNAGTSVLEVLELPSGLFWLRKQDLRMKRARQSYTVSPDVEWYPKVHAPDGSVLKENGRTTSNFKLADYERHLNEQFYDEAKGKVEPKHGRGGAQSRAHPYHLDDCETYQVALATYHEFFDQTQ